ncbi:MAG: gamma-glutamyl-gamma-aminobutyrate hydrolase family protein [Microthrixaceae bacterium]|jgi:GMP synthase-like glutamine amidotransferase|nr:gamma-glutamyl-gamma-aminobutyrate hydrolase family protein [Microthrixaceae bacterium]
MTEQHPNSASEIARVGLIQCGHVREDVATDHGDYPELFATLLADAPLDLVTYPVEDGDLPTGPRDCDAWLVSGSASSVYDSHRWIADTGAFLARVVEAEVPLVTVCFGHQLLAQAMGGKVERSGRGWGVGIQDYRVVSAAPGWPTAEIPTTLSLLASHQDQVTELPDGATVIAASDHCPVAAYSLNTRTVAVQAHPEFTPALTRDLITVRRDLIGPESADAALHRLEDHAAVAGLDDRAVARWFTAILCGDVR